MGGGAPLHSSPRSAHVSSFMEFKIMQHLAMFNTVVQQRGAKTGCIFLSPSRWANNRGGEGGGGGGEGVMGYGRNFFKKKFGCREPRNEE